MKKTANELYWYWSAEENKPLRFSAFRLGENMKAVLRQAWDLVMYSTKEECVVGHLQNKMRLGGGSVENIFASSIDYYKRPRKS